MKILFLTAVLPIFTLSTFAQSSSKNKALLKRFYKDVYRDWDMEVADELLSPDFYSHDWPKDGVKGPVAFRNYYKTLRKAIPDARYEVKDLIAEDDRVVVRWEMKGTHKGDFPGIDVAPTGQSITLKGVAVYRVENEKLQERWVISDVYGLLKEVQQAAHQK